MKIVVLSLYLLSLVSVSAFADSSDDYEKALIAFNAKEYEEAYVHLKNSLQQDSDNLSAKILMGKLLLRNGYLAEAELELIEALEMDADINLVIETLGNTWLFQRKYQEILDFENTRRLSPAVKFKWLLITATAHFSLKNYDQARIEYKKALAINPEDTSAINAYVSMEINQQRFDEAKRLIDSGLAKEPKNPALLHLQGRLAKAQDNLTVALTSFEAAYQYNNEDPLIRRSLLTLYISLQEFDKARPIIDEILEQTPDDPLATLLNSWMLAKENKNQEASEELERLSSTLSLANESADNNTPMLTYVAGLSAFAQGNYELARKDFALFLNYKPEHLQAATLLAKTLLKLNQQKAALDALRPHENKVTEDLDLALLLGELYIANNKAFKTVEILYRIENKFPPNKKIDLLAVKTMISRGKLDDALKMLNGSEHLATDVGFILTKSMLLLQMGELQQADVIADQLLEISNNNVDFLNFKAAVSIKLGKWREADNFTNKVLESNPEHYSGRFNKASILTAQNRFQDVYDIAAKLTAEQPENNQSAILFARALYELGQEDDAVKRLNTVLERDSDNLVAGELITTIFTRQGELDKAFRQLNTLLKNNKGVPKYKLQRARLYITKKQPERAIRELSLLSKEIENDASALLESSKIHLLLNQPEEARKDVAQANALFPTSLFLGLEFIRIHIVTTDFASAEAKLKALQIEHATNVELMILEGDLFEAQAKPKLAFASYLKAFKTAPSIRVSLAKLYQLTIRGVGADEFEEEISNFVAKYPDNHFQRNLLADYYLNAGNNNMALLHYNTLKNVKDLPHREFIFNNLANLYLQRDIAKALDYAEQAMAIDDNHPAILDTLGWIKSLKGEHAEALTILRKAFSINSNDPAVRYHLAYTLKQLGRLTEAKNEVQLALASRLSFSEREDAQKLLESI
jgi:putative PEP-CTERM system TPR-repeat lipoprotein